MGGTEAFDGMDTPSYTRGLAAAPPAGSVGAKARTHDGSLTG
jgi:hypothetical protein